ncbi:alpha beta hydrolase fold family [Phlyctema vagabunda]|uniref:Alpha beta hydrolase fold family n=1 Tax=Phlyctema vagabunda TaxID=108571 RepID=A0ABR4PB13_9HELO
MSPQTGILYVTMQPEPSLPAAQFHDWYNNEHGPLRLRLSSVDNGFRYRASDLSSPSEASPQKPEWMAIYDVNDMSELIKPPYTTLREEGIKSPREFATMKQIAVDRKFFDLVSSRESPAFEKLEQVKAEGQGSFLLAASIRVKPGQGPELDKWYDEEHIAMFQKIPGWLRTRRFVTAAVEGKPADDVEYLALHDFTPENGIGGPEFRAAVSTEWAQRLQKTAVESMSLRDYNLYYTFGPAPRDLESLKSPDTIGEWTYTSGATKTIPSTEGGAIESYVTTKDGVVLPYRLEGSSDPQAPLIVLANSVLVDYHIWDGFIKHFTATSVGKKYRFVRYLSRGRFTLPLDSKSVTIDVLASDIIEILDALRVQNAAALIGVSLGGVTVLNTAVKYPGRISSFISCDTSSKSPAGNDKAWGDRVAIAEKEGLKASSGETIVGEELAEMTTRRWFFKESYNNPDLAPILENVKTMVKTNSLSGFKKGVEALFAYDVKEEMKSSQVKGAFFVGSADGVLPNTMKEMSTNYGPNGAEYVVINDAGHLPMVEKPKEFSQAVEKLLSS